MKTYRYYEFVMAAFVTVLICSNLIGPAKILFWSYGSSFRWYNPVTWATALRFDRLLNVIQ